MSDLKIYSRSWPYILKRIGFVILGLLVWCLFVLGGYFLNKQMDGEGGLTILGAILGGPAFYFVLNFKSRVYRFAHIATVTEAVTGKGETKGAAKRGMQLYKSTFRYVSIFALIKDIFKNKHLSNVWQIITFYAINFIPYSGACVVAWIYTSESQKPRELLKNGFENFKDCRKKVLPKMLLAVLGDIVFGCFGIMAVLCIYVYANWGRKNLVSDSKFVATILVGVFWFLIIYIVQPYKMIGIIRAFIQKEEATIQKEETN